MYQRSEEEEQATKQLLTQFFETELSTTVLSNDENQIVQEVVEYVANRFPEMKYILGLALDFTLLAQRLASVDSDAKQFRQDLTSSELFQRYQPVTSRGNRQANTLTLKFEGTIEGIRTLEEMIGKFFHGLNRSKYPSAYVYNTGQWKKFENLLISCFRLSESGRFILCQKLINFGFKNLQENRFFLRKTQRVNLFQEIVSSYQRSAPNENAGLTFQSIAYGYFKANHPHLSFVVDKVRTGSARQRRFGDIDGYHGLDIEVSAEVKAFHISTLNLYKELGSFMKQVQGNKILGIAFVVSIDSDALVILNASDVKAITEADLLDTLNLWDWPKQDEAVHGMLHYLSHVEQNPEAVDRLLTFIAHHDPKHNSLDYYLGGITEQLDDVGEQLRLDI